MKNVDFYTDWKRENNMWEKTIRGLKNPKKRIRVSLLILYDILVIGIFQNIWRF